MKKTSSSLDPEVLKSLLDRFVQVVGDLRGMGESRAFLFDFMTQSEQVTFAKRLTIAMELDSGKSYEAIRREFGVSTATISSVSEMMKTKGVQLAIKKVKTEAWSEQMTNTFLKMFRKS